MPNRSVQVEATQEKLHGVDVSACRQVYELFGSNRGAGNLQLEAKAGWQGQGTRSTGSIGRFGLDGQTMERGSRNYQINYDAWQEFPGSADAGPEAIETVLSAIGACLIAMTTWHATRLGVEFESLQAHVSTTFNGQEFLFPQGDIESTASAFRDINYELNTKAPGATDDQVQALARLAAACPVCAMVGEKMNLQGTVKAV